MALSDLYSPTHLVIGSLNVVSLVPHLSAVLEIFVHLNLDVLCVQECGVRPHNVYSISSAVHRAGLRYLGQLTDTDTFLAVISRWPLRHIASPLPPHIFQVLQIHLPCHPPALLINLHLPQRSRGAIRGLLTAAVEFVVALTQHALFIGDWNRPPHDRLIGEICCSGWLVPCDSPLDFDLPTHRPYAVAHAARHLDYGIASSAFRSTRRLQQVTFADHDCVAYSFVVPALEPVHV